MADPADIGFLDGFLQFVSGEQSVIARRLARIIRTGGAAAWAVSYWALFGVCREHLGPTTTTIAVLGGVLLTAVSLFYVPAWRIYRKERLVEVDAGLVAAKALERFYVEKGQLTPPEVLTMRNALMKIGRGLHHAAP